MNEQDYRDSLISEISGFSTETLKKLATIGNSILTPMDTELLSVDFATMIDQVFKAGGVADRYFPEWTDRSSSDFGRFLVELFAMFSDKDFFYINNFSKESFLGVAEEYRSIFHKAINTGLNPPSNISAVGSVDVVFSAGEGTNVPRGSILLGFPDIPELVYSNQEFLLPTTTTDGSFAVDFIHGRVRQEDGVFDGHSIFIDVNGISTNSVRLIIDGFEWFQVDNFINGTENTRHFMVMHDEDGRAEVIFATGGLGVIPPTGVNYTVEYIVGGGYIGNIEAGLLTRVLSNTSGRNILDFTQFEMVGGLSQLPLEVLRQVTIGQRRHLNRAVTPEDVRYICQELTFIKKVNAEAVNRAVFIYALPIGGGLLSLSQKEAIHDHINSTDPTKKKLLMGYTLTVDSAILVPIKMTVDLYINSSTVRSSAELKARQILEEYLSPMREGTFGMGVNRSLSTAKLLGGVRGIENAVIPVLHRLGNPQAVADISFISQEVVDWENSDILIRVHGGI